MTNLRSSALLAILGASRGLAVPVAQAQITGAGADITNLATAAEQAATDRFRVDRFQRRPTNTTGEIAVKKPIRIQKSTGLHGDALRRHPRQPLEPKSMLLTLSAASLLIPFIAVNAQAQEAGSGGQTIEEVVVRGTATGTGIRGVAPVGSQVLNISREELLESPVRDPAEIISSLPQGSQLGSGVAGADGANESQSRGLNLRGLGGNASLQLLDGHRMVGQGVSIIGADPSAIPFAAIERVEVVLDGASAIYGSDAVAGVVNFIMRDDFEGFDVQASGRTGLTDSAKFELVGGYNWNNANIMFGFSHEYQSAMRRNERGYLMDDLRPYGGNDNRVTGNPSPGHPGIIRVGNTNYGVPENFVGVTDPETGLVRPTLEEVLATPPRYVDSGDYANYNARVERQGAFARASIDPTDTLRFTYTGMWSYRESRNETFGAMNITITPNSPYHISGLTNGNHQVRINTKEYGVDWIARPRQTTQNHYLDLRWDVGEWQVNSSAFWGRTNGMDIHRPEANNAALTNDPAGTPEGYLNYADFGNNPEWFNPYLAEVQPGLRDHLIGDTYRRGDQDHTGVNARLEGPVMELPAGTVRMSVGAEYIDSSHWLGLDQTVRYYDKRNFWLRDTKIDRQVGSVFVEGYVPLLGNLPAVQLLALSAAVRYDDYSDFGGTTNPRLGLTWDVNDDVSIRGSYGTAFRAPDLTQINPGVNSTLTRSTVSVDPSLGIPMSNPGAGQTIIFTRNGRTPTLGPETADMWALGLDYSPHQLRGLLLQLTYYNINYTDRIESLPNWQQALSSPENFAIYAPYIYPYTQPDNCVDGDLSTYSPILTQWLELEGTRFAGGVGDCQTAIVIDRGDQNVGSIKQNGLDFQASYRWDSGLGSWAASVNVAKILTLDRNLIHGGEWFTVLDRIGWQHSLRSNARLGWMNGNWTAALTARIEGGYTNDQTPTVDGVQLPDQKVGAWTTWDTTVSYRTPDNGTLWSGISASLGLQNLTDKQPPIVLNGSNAIDTSVHNPFGRMMRLEVGKRF